MVAFAERNKNAANRLKASWSAFKRQENEKNVRDPEVCSGFPLRGRRVVELNVLVQIPSVERQISVEQIRPITQCTITWSPR